MAQVGWYELVAETYAELLTVVPEEWTRYGFGADAAVEAGLFEIGVTTSALRPASPRTSAPPRNRRTLLSS